MFNEENLPNVYDNHSMFNRFQSIGGMRQSEGGTTPSVYITELKLRKALAKLTDIEIENIIGEEMTSYYCKVHRSRLNRKMENLHEWQLFAALNILLDEGGYDAFQYIRKCRKSDKEPK